jgi:hypothetical protein
MIPARSLSSTAMTHGRATKGWEELLPWHFS